MVQLCGSVLAAASIFIACNKADYDKNFNNQQNSSSNHTEGQIVLGKELEDPYALKNMQQAYENLKSLKQDTPDFAIEPTHVYIRFLPKNEEEWSLLKRDTSILLFDFPLNYEITEHGTYYHDPELPDSAITWQYTVLPIQYSIPQVKHEVLYEVFIPKDDDEELLKTMNGNSSFLAALEHESVRLTGNLPDEELKALLPSKWTPKGKIQVWDDIVNQYIPLVGAKVQARYLTHIEPGITGKDGSFTTKQFRYQVNYAIKWERADYDIRDGNISQAWYNGPKKKGEWNLDIDKGGKSVHYATIHRAAYRHFYGNNLDMIRPYGAANGKWKICYYDKNGTGDFWGNTGGSGLIPDIRIYGNSNSSKLVSDVFRTTVHEFGHAAHCAHMGNVQFWQVSKVIYESWAEAVEWALTNQEYEELKSSYSSFEINSLNKQGWPYTNSSSGYTSLFIDLVDDYNQSINNTATNIYPTDNVKGYTMKELSRNILPKSYGLSSLKSQLKIKKPKGVSDKQIDELFKRYEEEW